jgi:SAM-dependent methyltransferase
MRKDVARDPYEHLDAAERYIHRTRDRALLALLRRRGIADLGALRIVELGCGDGSLLRSLRHYGADPAALQGVDIDPRRVARARTALFGAQAGVADIAALPYRDGAFDLAFAFTLFSSVRDERVRRIGAAEALRVRRPGGLLMYYDYWTNPLTRRVLRSWRMRRPEGLHVGRGWGRRHLRLGPTCRA